MFTLLFFTVDIASYDQLMELMEIIIMIMTFRYLQYNHLKCIILEIAIIGFFFNRSNLRNIFYVNNYVTSRNKTFLQILNNVLK